MLAVRTLDAEVVPSILDRVVDCSQLFLSVVTFSFSITPFVVVVVSLSALYISPDEENKDF